jgi:hypothetical protein
MTNKNYLDLLKFAVINDTRIREYNFHLIPPHKLRNADFIKLKKLIIVDKLDDRGNPMTLNGNPMTLNLSEATIENIFKIDNYEVSPNPEQRILNTLNILSQFVGFEDFEKFKKSFDKTIAVRYYLPKILVETNYYEVPTSQIYGQEFLKHLNYLDVRVYENSVYALATIISENFDCREDPDGTEYYKYDILVICINQETIRVLNYANPKYVRHGAIDVDDKFIHVFTQNKMPKGYEFSGAIHSIPKDKFNTYQYCKPIFDYDNMGLMPFFKDGKVHHFRANNYHYCINDEIGEQIKPDDYNKICQSEISSYSHSILNDYSGRLNSQANNGDIIFKEILHYLEKYIII